MFFACYSGLTSLVSAIYLTFFTIFFATLFSRSFVTWLIVIFSFTFEFTIHTFQVAIHFQVRRETSLLKKIVRKKIKINFKRSEKFSPKNLVRNMAWRTVNEMHQSDSLSKICVESNGWPFNRPTWPFNFSLNSRQTELKFVRIWESNFRNSDGDLRKYPKKYSLEFSGFFSSWSSFFANYL